MPTRKAKAHGSRSRRHTRRRTDGRMMSVEGLHSAFQGIDAKMAKMIRAGRTDSELAVCLLKEWSTTFHSDLSAPAVKGMVSHYRAVHRASGTGSRRTRKAQRGGMAPLDYMLGQGTTALTYGQFPTAIYTDPTVIQSLDMNRFYESPIGRSCNATGGFDAPTQTGGGMLDALGMGHMPASVPRNVVETGVSTIQGHPIANPPSSPVAAAVPVSHVTPAPYDASAIPSLGSLKPVYQGY